MSLKDKIGFIILKIKKNQKGLFLFYGIFNTLLTNLLLQILLLFNPIKLSTLISQFFNLNLGFYLYSKKVFEVKTFKKSYYIKYLLISFFLWNINWIFITVLNSFNISKNLAALIVIPFLALISFMYQKNIVFSNKIN